MRALVDRHVAAHVSLPWCFSPDWDTPRRVVAKTGSSVGDHDYRLRRVRGNGSQLAEYACVTGVVRSQHPDHTRRSCMRLLEMGTITMRRLGDVAEQTPFGKCRFKQGEADMGDKGKRDKGKKEQQKKAQLSPKGKRKKKKEKKNK